MTDSTASPGRKIVFVATEDWFFASHFLPMARAARELGLDVAVIARVRDHRDAIEATGARVIPLETERRSINPMTAGYAAGQLASILKSEKPDLVHCIALKGILIGGAAAAMAGIDRRIYALTGLGFLGARRDLTGRVAQRAVRLLVKGLATRRTRYLFENADDSRWLGLDPAAPQVTIVGGAGVDADRFTPLPLRPMPPLRVAVVARMLWSKGVDIAVAATRKAREEGAAIELSLYGAPDPSNPKAIPEATLRSWDGLPGISWQGATADVTAVWRDHHVACLPSRGGEGLPRSLLEAAACGRAVVTTDVPGCRDLIRDGIEGLVVPPENIDALKAALVCLSRSRDLVARMGDAARLRVLDGFTERDVMEAVKDLYRSSLAS